MSTNHDSQKIGKFMWVGMWVLGIVLVTWFFGLKEKADINPNANLDPHSVEIVLKQNKQGHYVFDGKVNRQNVTFIVDTGATDVVIAGNVADKLKLPKGRRQLVSTANGLAEVYKTTIQTLEIGGIIFNNIDAVVNPNMADHSLLGMSALRQVEFSQVGKTLILKY